MESCPGSTRGGTSDHRDLAAEEAMIQLVRLAADAEASVSISASRLRDLVVDDSALGRAQVMVTRAVDEGAGAVVARAATILHEALALGPTGRAAGEPAGALRHSDNASAQGGPPEMPSLVLVDPSKLRQALEATLALGADLDPADILAHLVEAARSITGAQHGTVEGVVDRAPDRAGDGDPATTPPTGPTTNDPSSSEGPTARSAHDRADPGESGLRAGDRATPVLMVTVRAPGHIYGRLRLAGKEGGRAFTGDDQALAEVLARAAAIAMGNAHLCQHAQDAAVREDRDRMARDLHDTVIQQLFAVGLSLSGMARAVATDALSDQLAGAVTAIDDTMRRIRSTIYELGADELERGVRSRVLALVHRLDVVLGFEVGVSFAGPVDAALSGLVVEHLLATVGEALTNVGRHARATAASVDLVVAEGQCRLEIADNGVGLPPTGPRDGGLGLVNLRRRAEKLDGSLTVGRAPSGGTAVSWHVPVPG